LFDKSDKKNNKIIYFPENSFSLFDVVLELYTLSPAVFQFFDPFRKVGSLEAFKIRIHNSDDLLIGRKFLSPELDLEVWEEKKVTRDQIRRIGRMEQQFES